MRCRHFVRDYLTFTRKDRLAILVLLISISVVLLLPGFISGKNRPDPSTIDTAWISMAKRLQQKTGSDYSTEKTDEDYAYQYNRTVSNPNKLIRSELFYFDPNTASRQDWQKLGIRDKTITTIQNYISKGGRFKKPEDLKKIYGLSMDAFDRLSSFIRIENSKIEEITKADNPGQPFVKTSTPIKLVEINAADTSAFIALPGIGSKLAGRIVNFRDRLGGFYSIEQVGETYGLPDSTFQNIRQYLKLENLPVKKININTISAEELKAHPYIKWNLANPIIAYRNEHGSFTKLEDLKKIMLITEEVFKKIVPYLTLE